MVDQVLKQVIQVKNSLCLSRDYVGVFRRASDDQFDINGENQYGDERIGMLVIMS